MTTNAEIGSRLKKVRESAEVSQDALADAMGLRGFKWSNRTVWQVETGDRPMRLTEAIETCEVFGVSMDVLLGQAWPKPSSHAYLLDEAMASIEEYHRKTWSEAAQ